MQDPPDPDNPQLPPVPGLSRDTGVTTNFLDVAGLAVVDGHVLLAWDEISDSNTKFGPVTAWMVDAATGEGEWTYSFGPFNSAAEFATTTASPVIFHPAVPTGLPGRMFFKLEQLYILDPAEPFNPDIIDIRSADLGDGDYGGSFVLDGTTLYVTSRQVLQRLHEGSVSEWQYTLPSGEAWAHGTMAFADGVLYARSRVGDRQVLYAIDAERGSLRWRQPLGPDAVLAVAAGLVVTLDANGRLLAFGSAQGSPVVQLPSLDGYPSPGDTVEVDLGASTDGSLGPITQFAADWGDGAQTPWQASPQLSHRYTLPLDAPARFFVRNQANQTASAPFLFHVGGTPPGRSFVETAFSAENQNMTFFVLGLLFTLIGGLYGFMRLQRRLKVMQRELQAINASYDELRSQPHACERVLKERKSHAMALHAAGRIDEAKLHVLERRVEELMGQLRLTSADRRLYFLPHGMVLTLQAMLKDGRINDWEHHHFLEALAAERTMSSTQKREVKGMIDEWFLRDTAGA